MRRFATYGAAVSVLLIAPFLGSGPAKSQTTVDLDAIPELRLVEEQRIGSAIDPNIGFSRIGSVSVHRDGQVYVFESQDAQIRVYSSAGQLVRTIGRRGSGPGEFERGARMGVKGDTVWAVESSGLQGVQISLFRRGDGTLISSSRRDAARVPGRNASSLVLYPSEMRPNGRFISGSYSVLQMRGAPATGLGPGDTLRVPRLLFSADGIVVDTIAWQFEPPARALPALQYVVAGTNPRQAVPRPLSDADIATFFLDGRFVIERPTPQNAAAAPIRLRREGVRGETVYARSFRYRPVRYSAEVLDDMVLTSLRGGPTIIIDGVVQGRTVDTSAAARVAVRRAMSFPDFQPPVQGNFIGADAAIWLRREEARSPTIRWDLLDPQGNPRGRVNIPNRLRLVWSSGDTVWAVRPDENDVPWLVRFRISP